ncbi:MAG TPA: hypothetical protein VMA36_10080 [Candidatus Limnocylindria bacterium]|jgi:uncharacterized membrane protein YkvA (DUF1232 family)|nr:hypothetical protein [Candidatus Limnocylindria bacterium]
MRIIRILLHSRRTLPRLPGLLLSRYVPLHVKMFVVFFGVLIVSPLNIFGDIPFLGILDDAVLFALLLEWFVHAAERHEATATIDGRDLVVRRATTMPPRRRDRP